MEGSINLPGNRVTVGRNGQVAANITAREIVVLGKVRGNVSATDRVDIRAEGSLTGDVAAARISIEDGAFFKGGIDIRKPDAKSSQASQRVRSGCCRKLRCGGWVGFGQGGAGLTAPQNFRCERGASASEGVLVSLGRGK